MFMSDPSEVVGAGVVGYASRLKWKYAWLAGRFAIGCYTF